MIRKLSLLPGCWAISLYLLIGTFALLRHIISNF